jgi:hypothetical protein
MKQLHNLQKADTLSGRIVNEFKFLIYMFASGMILPHCDQTHHKYIL